MSLERVHEGMHFHCLQKDANSPGRRARSHPNLKKDMGAQIIEAQRFPSKHIIKKLDTFGGEENLNLLSMTET